MVLKLQVTVSMTALLQTTYHFKNHLFYIINSPIGGSIWLCVYILVINLTSYFSNIILVPISGNCTLSCKTFLLPKALFLKHHFELCSQSLFMKVCLRDHQNQRKRHILLTNSTALVPKEVILIIPNRHLKDSYEVINFWFPWTHVVDGLPWPLKIFDYSILRSQEVGI